MQPFNVAWVLIVDVIFVAVLLELNVNGVICPDPESARPILALEFVHEKVAPTGLLLKSIGSAVVSGHAVMLVIGFTVGVGSIEIVNVEVFPTHPLRVGITDIEPVIAAPDELAGAE